MPSSAGLWVMSKSTEILVEIEQQPWGHCLPEADTNCSAVDTCKLTMSGADSSLLKGRTQEIKQADCRRRSHSHHDQHQNGEAIALFVLVFQTLCVFYSQSTAQFTVGMHHN